MELPHLGEHCSIKSCNLLDFLPIKCDACKQVFCRDHYTYSGHNCPSCHGSVQVPVCPLCNVPVTGFKPGDQPDIAVSQHIDNQCKNSARKVYTNRCSHKSCKTKEMIPIQCSSCKKNFCLKHRHSTDHDCQKPAKPVNKTFRSFQQEQSARAALDRQMNEDEELARALQASLNEESSRPNRNIRSTGGYMQTQPSSVEQSNCNVS